MIQVNDKYKKAIKNDVRELDAYVEILVDAEYVNAEETQTEDKPYVSSETIDSIASIKTVADDDSLYNRYASLEEGYTQLDGSFTLPNKNFPNNYTGFIGEYEEEAEINISNIQEPEPITYYGETYYSQEPDYYTTIGKNKITIYFDKIAPKKGELLPDVKPKIEVELVGVYQRIHYNPNESSLKFIDRIEKTYTQIYEDDNKIFREDNNNQMYTTEPLPDVINETDPYYPNLGEQKFTFFYIKNIKIKVHGYYRLNQTMTFWGLQSSRIRIKQINLGQSVIYDNKEIISIDINEQSDIYNLDVPNNTCSVKLNNYDRKFNVADKNNILNKLNKNSVIRLYYGIAIDSHFEYLNMGNYEYISYEDNNNLDTTINGIGSIQELETQFPYLGYASSGIPHTLEFFCQEIFNQEENTNINDFGYIGYLNREATKFNNKREEAQALAIFSNSYVKQLRIFNPNTKKNYLCLKKISNNEIDTIELSQQTNQPKFRKITKTKELNIANNVKGEQNSELSILYEDNISPDYYTSIENYRTEYNDTVRSNVAYKDIFIKSNTPFSIIIVYINDERIYSDFIYQWSDYGIELRVWLNDYITLDNINIKVKTRYYDNNDITTIFSNSKINSGSVIEYNNNYLNNYFDRERVAKFLFKNEKDYEFEIEIMGDPSLETGDTILIESVDGYKKGIIQSINFNYNGGLIANIKGVCSDAI